MKGLDAFRNTDGTVNGIKFFAKLTGLSEDEIAWIWKRTKELRAAGVDPETAKSTVKHEAASRPWEKTT